MPTATRDETRTRTEKPRQPAVSLKEILAAGNPVTFLQIGECIIARRPRLISTVLGSCVSATFHHASGFGAIFHAILPEQGPGSGPESCRFVNSCVALVARRLNTLVIPAGEVDVKLFGGALTIEPERKAAVRQIVDVGARNVEVARRELAKHGFHIRVEQVLGERGRKLFFWTGTGDVWLKILQGSSGTGGPQPAARRSCG